MKKILLLFVTLATGSLLASAQDRNTPYLTKSLSNTAIRTVDLQTSGGSLQVFGTTDSEARLEVYVTGNNGNNHLNKEEIEKRLAENYELNISATGGNLVATARSKGNFSNWRKSLSISFKAYVPKNASAQLKTSGGSLSVDGINGTVEGATSGGSIRVANINNRVDVKTSGGSIDAENVSGTLSLITSGGSINMVNLKGTVDAKTSGGSISASNVNGDLLARTSGGSIRIEQLAGSADLSTSAGSTTVSMSKIDKYLRIKNSAGSVRLRLPMMNKGLNLDLQASKVHLPSLQNFSGTMENNRVNGQLNGGGIPVDVQVSAGSLTIENI